MMYGKNVRIKRLGSDNDSEFDQGFEIIIEDYPVDKEYELGNR